MECQNRLLFPFLEAYSLYLLYLIWANRGSCRLMEGMTQNALGVGEGFLLRLTTVLVNSTATTQRPGSEMRKPNITGTCMHSTLVLLSCIMAHMSPRDRLKMQILTQEGGQGWTQRSCTSKKLQGKADATGLWTTLQVARV